MTNTNYSYVIWLWLNHTWRVIFLRDMTHSHGASARKLCDDSLIHDMPHSHAIRRIRVRAIHLIPMWHGTFIEDDSIICDMTYLYGVGARKLRDDFLEWQRRDAEVCVCVFVCGCVCERERERLCMCVCVIECVVCRYSWWYVDERVRDT